MTRALVTQLLEALLTSSVNEDNLAQTTEAITAAREYLATEPTPTLTEALAQQGIKLRTEFEPKQRDSELATEPSGERAELIADLRELIDLHAFAKDVVDRAAHLLEADAQQAKRVPISDGVIAVITDACFQAVADQGTTVLMRAVARDITPAGKPTGWNNGLSQDYCAEFGQWLASRPGARQQIKAMFDTSTPLQP